MWLINTTTLKLEFFINPENVSYLVLSHTWGDEEISFQEFLELDNSTLKSGLTKIQRTCDIARQQKFKYVWIDTCCIDKSNSAELSEAINSMFNWYRNSAICLAYLEDLPGNVDFDKGLANCRWLSRGWTLQELIAPKHVSFYDQTWTKRATKSTSKTVLAKATGVDENILADSTTLTNLSIAQRMSWVSRRQTTRPEDIAYCMLGIFDINMPLIYGEGYKAFTRLQEEIAKQTCDLSLFAWTALPPDLGTDLSNFRGIFARSPAEFINCNRIRPRNSFNPYKEFTVTNRGLRIEATLIKLFMASPDDLVLNLGVAYQDATTWATTDGNGWIGIYLRKCTNGYVRVWSHQLYVSGEHGRGRCPRAILHIRKDISKHDAELLEKQYLHAIHILDVSSDIRMIQTEPSDLWDYHKDLFLDPGTGLNIYLLLKVYATKDHTSFQAIVACSTMGLPTCIVWTEQHDRWDQVCRFLAQAKEVTDYTCVDYLQRDLVPVKLRKLLTASSDYVDHKTGFKVILEAKLNRDFVEGCPAFAITVSKRGLYTII